ncbi:alginate export family protein [Novosphingobium sp. MMS21-SN21R]|uniref:alginate export family protein n=1 Tax=Novosphingobium sp. MMS21-SN21R TaxID=2969298 RepID=UPI0028839481|nr:alginate export family protein [Novosphingobium sp. MMS21-SN21R]MDT0508525.1 alginate export family protein [Novosphingobium sp. MMS21-SN21R]
MKKHILAAALLASPIALAHPAFAADKPFGDPVPMADGLTFDPIIDARIRYEAVDQPTVDADAVTARLRAGFEIKHAPSHLSFLVEAEGTLGLNNEYNAFPFALPGSSQRRPGFAVVPDGESIDLNRLQVQYKTKAFALTVGRQRINLDDQRFVGSVGWRQNEQTFDAVRAEATLGPVSLDGTYAIQQDSIFGSEAGPRRSMDGDFVFLNASAKVGPLTAKAFSYLIDYDEAFAFTNSSQTYGARISGSVPLSKAVKLNILASYARQMDMGRNPVNYEADYVAGELGLAVKGFTLTGGYELLGADKAAGKSFQTPLATLHKFNGWADLFLTTPAAGLEDTYVSLAKVFPKVKALPGLNASVVYHEFRSDLGSTKYGTEWDASLGFKVNKVGLLVKFADYNANKFGVDKRILWLQAEVAF